MRNTHTGFSLVELLTVIAIISLLLSISVPALHEVRMRARVSSEELSIATISSAVENFYNDMGYYPPSQQREPVVLQGPFNPGLTPFDQGAQRLVEALFGLDFIGYQAQSWYEVADGTGIPEAGTPIGQNGDPTKRWGPYLKRDSMNIKKMTQVHPDDSGNYSTATNVNPVFADKLDVSEPRAILYYAANPSGNSIGAIYHYEDNMDITQDCIGGNSMYEAFDCDMDFWGFIWDPKTGYDTNSGEYDPGWPSARPMNADTFILIGAGRDHLYGTKDDITNFDSLAQNKFVQ